MNTFVVTLFAIPAAAAVIAAFLAAKCVDKWTDAKNRYVAQISSLYKTANDISAQPIFPLSERNKNIRRMSDTINRVWRVELDLRSPLENKPFRLRLSKSEKKLLDNTRTDIEELKRLLSPPDATRSPEPDKADEKESFDNLLQNIQSASAPGDTHYAFPGDAKVENPNADSVHAEIEAHACADSLSYSAASTRVQDDA
jgi:hypothetical protein